MAEPSKKKLKLSRETLASLASPDLDQEEVMKALTALRAGFKIPWSKYFFLCLPSDVETVCHTHCPRFTCTR